MSSKFLVPNPFVWNESFTVQDDEMDMQHRQMFEYLQGLTEKPSDLALLDKLLDFVRYHFKSEEDRFRMVDFDDQGPHKQTHDRFALQVQDLRKGLGDKGKLKSSDVMMMKKWLVNHIKGSDSKYAGKLEY